MADRRKIDRNSQVGFHKPMKAASQHANSHKVIQGLGASFLVVCVVVGCAGPERRVKTALYDTTPRTPVTKLDVFQVREKPTRPFHVIALLTADGPAHDEGDCMQGMLIRARKLGADGLIIEVHPRPQEAWSDGPQSVTPPMFAELMKELREYVRFESRYLNGSQ